MDCFLREPKLAENVLDHTTMVTLQFNVTVLGGAATRQLAL